MRFAFAIPHPARGRRRTAIAALLFALGAATLAAAQLPVPATALDPDACAEVSDRLPWQGFASPNPIARQLWFNERRAFPAADRGLFPWSETPAGANLRAGVTPPDGYAPVPALDRELEAARAAARALPVRASLEPWRSIGPANIAGRIPALAFDPADPLHLYAGGAVGGVWESHDAGGAWTPLTDGLESMASGALAVDPSNPAVVYYATGEAQLSISSYNGRGLFRSTDGGATWTRLGLEFVPRFSRILVDPADSQVLWAAAYWNPVMRGVLKSTNGGTTWASALSKTDITGLVMDLASSQILYAAVGSIWGSGENGIYKTTDGGAAWTQLTAGLPPPADIGRMSLAIAPSNGQILYAGISSDFSGGTGGMINIYRTANGGATWTSLGAPVSMGLDWYHNVLAVHPANPQIVLAGGLEVWRSTSGGTSWANVGAASGVHVDIHQLAFHPLAPEIVYLGCDGGVWLSVDTGASWIARNTGLVTVQYYAIGLDPSRELTTYGGTQDNWMNKTTGATTWQYLYPPVCGDVGWIRVSPIDSRKIYATTCALGAIGRSSDEGATWVNARSGIGTESANWVPPIELDLTAPDVLFAGTSRIYKTTNQGALWVPKSGDLGATVTALAISPASSSVVWAGANARKLRSTDGGESWADRTAGTPYQYTTDFAPSADPGAALTALVTVGGYGNPHVLRTTNGGDTWANASGDLPDAPANSIAILPWNESAWIAGTDVGAFSTEDGGAHWQALASGLPNVVVSDLWIHPATGLVRAGTMGRGAWEVVPGVPGAVADPTALDFGPVQVGGNAALPITFSNDGTGPLHVAGLVLEGANPGDFAVEPGGAGFILLPGDSAARAVRFTPAVGGPRSALLHLVNEVEGGAEVTVPLDGLGLDAAGAPAGPLPTRPARLVLGPPAPNPSPGRVAFAVELPAPGPVRLVVYNAGGQRVRTIVEDAAAAGEQTLIWDGRADRGEDLPSGTYFVRLESAAGAETRKALLVR